MIQERTALYRQVQAFFHDHLVGLYDWDSVEFDPAEKVERTPGKRLEAGKTHDRIGVRFGPFSVSAHGPFDDFGPGVNHPCGLIVARSMGGKTVEGPLDATTWDRIASFIRENREEHHGVNAGENWGH